jgi:hypothetical protein
MLDGPDRAPRGPVRGRGRVPHSCRRGRRGRCLPDGEIGYHRFFGLERDIQLLEIGHFESEQYTVGLLERLLHEPTPRCASSARRWPPPIRYVV